MILAIDKPTGITSYDVIRRLKKIFPKRKIGHSGTLDPMATGLLLIGIDKDTKRLGELQGLSKKYITTVDFSKMSDTWDMDFWEEFEEYKVTKAEIGTPLKDSIHTLGIVKNNKFIPAPKEEEINEKLKTLVPIAMLPLTPFSAKKKDGKKLYELARKGEKIIEDKEMKILGYKILEYSFPEIKLELEVGSGTYIRSIGYWLGQEFGLGGILTSLRRTNIGEYDLEVMALEKFGDELMGKEVS